MDESPDHEPTLIERGMGVHLNHPPTARRGIRNSRPDRWGLWRPQPPSRGRTARARFKQDEELAAIVEWAQARGLDARLHLMGCAERGRYQLRVRHRSRLRHRRCRLRHVPRSLTKFREKLLQEYSRSCRASGARPAGLLTRPHGKAFATRMEEHPISRIQHLGEPDRYAHRSRKLLSGTATRVP
jgi:hypothetical protein